MSTYELSKRERKWRRFYLFVMIMIYGLVIPLALSLFFVGESFPLIPIFVGIALPFMRNNHLKQIRQQEYNGR
ncbi:hypothetical protein ACWE42_20185 [Sutcliffiella cohnii]